VESRIESAAESVSESAFVDDIGTPPVNPSGGFRNREGYKAQPLESKFFHQRNYQLHHCHYPPNITMFSLANTTAPVQDTITNLASYHRLVDSLTDVDYMGSGIGLERRRQGATRASDEMVLTFDGEVLVAYRAVATQAAAEANQIRLDADLATQGEAMWIMQKMANNGQCAMFMEPVHDQPAPAERQRAWDTPDNQGWNS